MCRCQSPLASEQGPPAEGINLIIPISLPCQMPDNVFVDLMIFAFMIFDTYIFIHISVHLVQVWLASS